MKGACRKPFPQLNLIRWCYHLQWFWALFVVSVLVRIWQWCSCVCALFVCKCKSAFVCKYGRNMLCNHHKPHMWSCLCVWVYESAIWLKWCSAGWHPNFHNAVLTSISHWRDSSCRTACFFTCSILSFSFHFRPGQPVQRELRPGDLHHFLPPTKLRSPFSALVIGWNMTA